MDHRINYRLVLDVETANTLEDPLPYDIGICVADKRGNIYERRSYAVRELFIDERAMMRSAYYADKLPSYSEEIRAGQRKLDNFFTIRRKIFALMEEYNITEVYAYNARFDITALNNLTRWLTGSRSRYFFPANITVKCIWNMACQTICQRKTYRDFCEAYIFLANNDKNYKTSAEIVYRYLTLNPDFEEEHKGIDDVNIETSIMAACYASHKAMPHGQGIRRNCWQDVKRTMS